MYLPDSDSFDYEASLAACAQGDRRALQLLYVQEGPRLLGVARRIVRDDGMAEDIVHDTFMRIWSSAGRFDPARGSARGWIFSIARHLSLNVVRDRSREIDLADEEDLPADPASSLPEEARCPVEAGVESGRLDGCLEQLEPTRRECIIQAYVEGYSHGEISHRLGAPLGTVKAWIRRSLLTLRECMG